MHSVEIQSYELKGSQQLYDILAKAPIPVSASVLFCAGSDPCREWLKKTDPIIRPASEGLALRTNEACAAEGISPFSKGMIYFEKDKMQLRKDPILASWPVSCLYHLSPGTQHQISQQEHFTKGKLHLLEFAPKPSIESMAKNDLLVEFDILRYELPKLKEQGYSPYSLELGYQLVPALREHGIQYFDMGVSLSTRHTYGNPGIRRVYTFAYGAHDQSPEESALDLIIASDKRDTLVSKLLLELCKNFK